VTNDQESPSTRTGQRATRIAIGGAFTDVTTPRELLMNDRFRTHLCAWGRKCNKIKKQQCRCILLRPRMMLDCNCPKRLGVSPPRTI
jgi:hypothetical protein